MDPRISAVQELAERYQYDAGHAHQVEALAGALFLALEPLHCLGREERKLLEYASVLHDIGRYLTERGHHRHTLHLIMMEPLTVFTREEKTVIANIARYHRKALPGIGHTAYAILTEEDRRVVNLLAPILRMADALDSSKQGIAAELECTLTDEALTLYVGTDRDISQERAALEKRKDMFLQVYNRELCLLVRPARIML